VRETEGHSGGRRKDDAQVRKILELAALEASGESGYRELTVQGIVDRAGLDRRRFYRCFEDQWACYAAAYADTVDELVADLRHVAKRQEGWLPALRAALAGLGTFLEAEPMLARGILLEVHVAGGSAVAKRDEVFERLSRAIDSARRENESRHSPPPIAARLILNTIEATVSRYLVIGEPEQFADAVPDLLYIAVSIYFGRDAAEAEFRRASE
jgi:AcrR family transcriptional regulator